MGFFENLGMVQRLGAAALVVLLLVVLLVKQRSGSKPTEKAADAPKGRKGVKAKAPKATSAKSTKSDKTAKGRRGRKTSAVDATAKDRRARRGRRRKGEDADEAVETTPAVGRMVPRLPSAADSGEFGGALGPLSEETADAVAQTTPAHGAVDQPGWPDATNTRWSEQAENTQTDDDLPADATQPIDAVSELPAADDADWATDADDAFDPATGWTADEPVAATEPDPTHTEWTEETSDWTSGEAGWETVAPEASEPDWTADTAAEPVADATATDDWVAEADETAAVSDWEPVDELEQDTAEPSFTDWGSAEPEAATVAVEAAEPEWVDPADQAEPSFTDWAATDVDAEAIEVEPIEVEPIEVEPVATFEWDPAGETDETLADDPIEADVVPVTTSDFTIEGYDAQPLGDTMPMVFDEVPASNEAHVPSTSDVIYADAGQDSPPIIDAVEGMREITISALEGDDAVDATVIHSPAFERRGERADLAPVVDELATYADQQTPQVEVEVEVDTDVQVEPVYALQTATPLTDERYQSFDEAPAQAATPVPPLVLDTPVPETSHMSATAMPTLPAPVPSPLERWAGLTPITTERRRPTLNPMRSWERLSAGPMPERVGEPMMSASAPAVPVTAPRVAEPTTPAGALANSVFSMPAPRAAEPTPVRRADDALAQVGAPAQTSPAAAWWDMPIDQELTARRGRFALGGYALQAGHQVVSGVTFREAAIPPPTSWLIGPVQGQVPPGTLVLTVDGCLNCRPEDLVVLMEPGFAPTQDGFSLRLSGLQAGAFAASGTYLIA